MTVRLWNHLRRNQTSSQHTAAFERDERDQIVEMKAALYVRVSTRDKDQNPETQLRLLREYVERREWTVEGEYIDYAAAGQWGERQAWLELRSRVEGRNVDAVVVLRLDRAFRSVKDTHDGLEYFDRYGVGFVSATQDLDTSSASGRLVLNLLAVFAEFESDMISERVSEGIARAQAEGSDSAGRLVQRTRNPDVGKGISTTETPVNRKQKKGWPKLALFSVSKDAGHQVNK